MVGDAPLDDARTYTLATNDYMATAATAIRFKPARH